jgi:tetratricopeptide (TPR) repeat protein
MIWMRVLAAGILLLGFGPAPLAAQGAADQALRVQGERLRRNPFDARVYYDLGDAYIQKARETGDAAHFVRAEGALRKALILAPEYAPAARHLAYALYMRHAFAEAAAQARQAVSLDPGDSHAWGVLGDALLESGRYPEAGEAYEQMRRLGADLYSLTRVAGWKSVHGDPAGAIADLEGAVEAGRRDARPREAVAWALWQLGAEHFSAGRLAEADARYREALATSPRYHRALAGLAQVRAAQGRHAQAIELYRDALAVVPQPDYAAALGDVYRMGGQLAEARQQYDLVEYIGRLSALNRILYNRELALFYADHDLRLDEALELARRELEIRQDVYAYDLLAWVLYRHGRLTEAREAMQQALRLGTRDARLFFHAGLIERGLGRGETARAYLRQALGTNPHFHPFHAAEAARVLHDLEDGARPGASDAS